MRCSRKHMKRKSCKRISSKKNACKKHIASSKQKKMMINSREQMMQKGGLGYNKKYWNQHPDFNTTNMNNANFMLNK